MSVEKLEILDLILELLNGNSSLTLYKIEDKANEKTFKQAGSPDLSELEMVTDSRQVKSESINALEYLEDDGYIGRLGDDIYYLNYKGVLKHFSGGFVGEANGTIRRNSYNYFFGVATPVVAFSSLLMSIYLLFRGGL
jgi:hypothetical protein